MARGEDCEDDIPLFSNFFFRIKNRADDEKPGQGRAGCGRKPLSTLPVGPPAFPPLSDRAGDSSDPLF